jgi:hypothetical protein
MPRALKVGDRVRLTAWNRVSGYRPGDRGTVQEALADPAGGEDRIYFVAMDADGIPGATIAFAGYEVEADREPAGTS